MKPMKYFATIGLLGMLVSCVGDLTVKMPLTTDKAPTELLAEVKVNDLRVAGSKRTAAFGVPMGSVEFNPPAVELIKQKLEAELTKLLTESGVRSKRFYIADLVEFSANTNTTPLYWDVIGRVHLILKSGKNQHDLFGTHTKRTYIWPGEKIIKQVINESLRQIVEGLKPVPPGLAYKSTEYKSITQSQIVEGLKSVPPGLAYRSTGQRRFFLGFSIVPPAGDDWIITQKDRTRIHLNTKTVQKQNYALAVFAISKLVAPPLYSIASLAEFAEKSEDLELGRPDRRLNYYYDISIVRINERDCVRADFSAQFHSDPRNRKSLYMLEGVNFYCLHPESNTFVVVIGYNQSYKKGITPLALEGEAQQFVKSLSFEHLDE